MGEIRWWGKGMDSKQSQFYTYHKEERFFWWASMTKISILKAITKTSLLFPFTNPISFVKVFIENTKKVFARKWFCWKPNISCNHHELCGLWLMMGPKSYNIFHNNSKTSYWQLFCETHLWLEHVHGPADVRVHPVPLEAHEDPLLEGQAQRAPIDEAEEHTDQLNKQNASNTDAILQISSHSSWWLQFSWNVSCFRYTISLPCKRVLWVSYS